MSHPMNQTVRIGDIAEFECSTRDCTGALRILVNDDVQVAPRIDTINSLDSREYGVTMNKCENGVLAGTFWMYVNNRTINQVRSVTCRIDGVRNIIQETGYIEVGSLCSPCVTEIKNEQNSILDTEHMNCTPLDSLKASNGNERFNKQFLFSVILCYILVTVIN